jgi:Ca-activated chloride channel family protein
MTSPCPVGLVSSLAQPVALAGVRISGTVSGPVAELELVQRYVNTESVPIEAVYLFPLDAGSAVYGFSMKVGERVREGRVEEREKAFATYDDAMASGHGAALLDLERPDVFRASVGNILAGQTVEIRIRWATTLTAEGTGARLRVPLTVSPRYSPAEPGVVGETEAERLNPERWWNVPYGLSLSLDATWPGGLKSVESPSHPIRVENSTGGVRVSLTREDAPMDRDVVFVFEPLQVDRPVAVVGVDAQGRRHVAVSFRPSSASASRQALEVVFLVDCSGSMDGSSIDEARRALALSLRTLEAGDSFNIVRFGSTFTSWQPKAVPFDAGTLAAGTAYAQATQADLGGTEILGALKSVLESGGRERTRCVVLLTDGQVSNEDEVITLAKAHASTTRIYSFGIGAGVSEHLVRSLARVTRGACELVFPGERVEPKVLRQLGRVRTPVFDDVRLEWPGLSVEPAPATCPPVYLGDRLIVYGRVVSGRGASATLTVGGVSYATPFELELPVAGRAVASLWARTRIEQLEDGTVARRGSAQSRRSVDSGAEVRALALEYQLASSETSWVAVDVREGAQVSTEPVQLRRVPLAVTSGWGGGGPPPSGSHAPMAKSRMMASQAPPAPPGMAAPATTFGAPMEMMRMITRSAPAKKSSLLSRMFGSSKDDLGAERDMFEREEFAAADAAPSSPRGGRRDGAAPASLDLYDLLLAQEADGRFGMSAWAAAVTAKVATPSTGATSAVVITSFVLLLLQRRFGDRKDEWRAAAEKATRWLSAQSEAAPSASVLEGWLTP